MRSIVPSEPAKEEPNLRRTYPRGDERKRAIIAAAIECYETNGTRRAILADIANRIGVTPGNILYHFGSKQGLITAVVQELEDRRTAAMEAMAAEGGVAMLRALSDYSGLTQAHPNLAALALILAVENLGPDDPAHDYFVRQGERDRMILRRGLERGIQRGELRSDFDIGRTIETVLAFCAGAWLNWLLDPAHISLERQYDHFFSGLIRDLAVRPAWRANARRGTKRTSGKSPTSGGS
jgi:AcrR family transcriptional regulator